MGRIPVLHILFPTLVRIDVLRLREILFALEKLSTWEIELRNNSFVRESNNEERPSDHLNSFSLLEASSVIAARLNFAKDS